MDGPERTGLEWTGVVGSCGCAKGLALQMGERHDWDFYFLGNTDWMAR
jgi:hypothetical protein